MGTENSIKYTCPNCACPLSAAKDAHGASWQCPSCKGCAVGIWRLQKSSKPELISELWRKAKQENRKAGKPCPACRKTMLLVVAQPKLGSVELDVCGICQFVWFDKNELAKIPRATAAEIAKNENQRAPVGAPPPQKPGALHQMVGAVADNADIAEDVIDLIRFIF